MKNASEFWEEALVYIRSRISKVGFTTFFNNVKPLYYKEDIFYLSTAHSIYKDMFEIYEEVAVNGLSEVMDKPMKIEIMLEEEIPVTEDYVKPIDPVVRRDSALNKRFTFDTFIVGSNNQFAYSVSYAIAQGVARDSYNPFLVYGGSGLGKTHLLHAIGNEILLKDPTKKVLYVTSESFLNSFIESIRTENIIKFRQKFRTIDLLLLDDIQFFAGKEGVQEEFFHTFNELITQGKQIILTSDRPPKDIYPLEERLRTRISGGLMADIQPPDFETRMAILHSKAQLNNFDSNISDSIFELVATQVKSNIRELEGAIRTIVAYSDISKREVDIDTANNILKDYFISSQRRKIDAEYIIREVEKHFNLKDETLVSKNREKEISYARQIAMYIVRELLKLSFPEIGKEFGGRNHATVIHNVNEIKKKMEEDLNVMNNVNDLMKNIKNDED